METVLTEAVKEKPVPTLDDLRKRLGYTSSESLQRHFPGLCQQILARRRAAREEKITEVKRTLHGLLLEVPAISVRVASKRVGVPYAYLRKLCPEECGALASRHRRWRSEASELRKQDLFKEVRQLVRQIYDEGYHPTVGRVASLSSRTALREWKTLHVKAARQAIGNE